THALSAAPPRNGAPPPSPACRPPGPPAPPGTAAPRHPAPPAHPAPFTATILDRSKAPGTRNAETGRQFEVSPSYRNYCQPATGTASATCRPGTGITVSSIYRDCTPCTRANMEQTWGQNGHIQDNLG